MGFLFYGHRYIASMQRTKIRYSFLFSTGKMCKFSRTLYNGRLIQFARIPVEFVVRFIRYQNRVKVITFSIAAQYLLLIFPYNSCLRDLRVQFLDLFTACILSQYHWDKAFHFPGKFHFLVKKITDSVRLRVVYLNLVLSTANGVMFCEIYLQSAVHNEITTIHDLFRIYFISSFFKPILDLRFSTPDPRSQFSGIPRSSAH